MLKCGEMSEKKKAINSPLQIPVNVPVTLIVEQIR